MPRPSRPARGASRSGAPPGLLVAGSPQPGGREASRRAERGGAPREQEVASEGARTCAGCGRRVAGGRDLLVRVVFGPAGAIAIDGGEGAFGRGAYVHPSVDCVRVGGARGLARRRPRRPDAGPSVDGARLDAIVAQASEEPAPKPLDGLTVDGEPLTSESLRAAVVAAYKRRLGGLFSAARRARSVVHGADACCSAIASGEAAVVVVATDAAAAAERTEVRTAIGAGRAVAWGSKQELGELADAGREEGLAVVAILDARIGLAARDAVRVMDALRVPFTHAAPAPPEGGAKVRSGLVERRA